MVFGNRIALFTIYFGFDRARTRQGIKVTNRACEVVIALIVGLLMISFNNLQHVYIFILQLVSFNVVINITEIIITRYIK